MIRILQIIRINNKLSNTSFIVLIQIQIYSFEIKVITLYNIKTNVLLFINYSIIVKIKSLDIHIKTLKRFI